MDSMTKAAHVCLHCGQPRQRGAKFCSSACFGHFRARTPEVRFWRHVVRGPGEECWLWTAATRRGYGIFGRSGGKRAGSIVASRFAWEITHGPIPAGMLVLHRCDRPACVRPDHLFLGTARENAIDMVQKRRHPTMRTLRESVTLVCRACGVTFHRRIYSGAGVRAICSHACGRRLSHPVLKCELCGKSFTRRVITGLPSPRFCSMRCKGIDSRQPCPSGVCETCGKAFTAKAATHSGRFCSLPCYRARHA